MFGEAAAVVEGAAIVAPPLFSFGRSLEQVPLTTQLPDTKTAILCFHPGCFYLNLNWQPSLFWHWSALFLFVFTCKYEMYRLRNSFDQMKGQVSNCIYCIKVMISLSHQIITLDLSTASTYNRWLLNTSCHWYMKKQEILTQIVERTEISFIWPQSRN